ncbi:MAG: hypothetical protein LBK99_13130 [Opitutaceae bacterium]|jgi:hypothetical protein|nr:hypothetical protein [Opitutaceae bacterium]
MIRRIVPFVTPVAWVFATCLVAAPQTLTDWRLQAPDHTTAERTESGSIRLMDDSAEDFPRAITELQKPVSQGELRWRVRNTFGMPSFALWLGASGSKGKAWDVAAYQDGIHIRQKPGSGIMARVSVGQRFLRPDNWIDFRLVFDTSEGRAQLYLNDQAAPNAEVSGFVTPIGYIELVAGYGSGVSHGAEFADPGIESRAVTFAAVDTFSVPPVWPSETPAPENWVVQDKFQQFAGWWPGPSDGAGEAARGALKKAMHREALGLGNEFTDALRIIPRLANAIRWTKPYAGAQASHLYRSNPQKHTGWDEPSNTRLMEPVALLARFYALNQPWNPYRRDTALGKRLHLALEYWLSLQNPDGGFPEYGGIGSSELPSVSFGLDAMVPVYQSLRDEPLFSDLAARWLESMRRAIDWAARPDSPPRRQGETFANQYLGVIYAAWHLHEFTGESRWLQHYNKLTDWWTTAAQPAGWYREHGGREDFSYSQVSEFIVDRLASETGDVRWRDSLRRAYAASQLLVGFEMDREVAVVDSAGYARTGASTLNASSVGGGSANPSARGPQPGQRTVGRYNHAATQSNEALAFAIGALTPQEADQRAASFFADMPKSLQSRAPRSIYNPYASYWWDGTGDYWSLPAGAGKKAVEETRVWRESRFVEIMRLAVEDQEIVGIRRPGYYVSLHAGRANGRQNKGAGLLWMPGFGSVFVSANESERPVFGWSISGRELAARQKSLRLDWRGEKPDTASQVSLLGLRQPVVHLQLGDDQLGIVPTNLSPQKAFCLPMVLREGDRWILSDGTRVNPFDQDGTALVGQELRIQRSGDGVTHDVMVRFSSNPRLVFAGQPMALGFGMFVRGLSVAPASAEGGVSGKEDFRISFSRVRR